MPRNVRKTLLGIGLLLLLLGMGNFFYGSQRVQYYSELLAEEEEELTALSRQGADAGRASDLILGRQRDDIDLPDGFPAHIIVPNSPSIEQRAEHVDKINARLAYYRFSVLGGKCFLALAGICFLVFLLTGRNGAPKGDLRTDSLPGSS